MVITEQRLVWVGVSLAVFGQFLGASSMLLMKRAAILESDRPFALRPTFQCGFAIFFFNTVILDAAVYALAPLAIVAPISALGIVFVNIGVAHGCLVAREHFGMRGILANALIVLGLVAASACGPHINTTPSLQEMYAMAAAPAFLVYVIPALALSLSCCLALCLRLLPARSDAKAVWCATSAAIFGSLSVLSFKGVATVVRLTLEGNNQLAQPGTWLLLAAACIFAPANVTLMVRALESASHSCELARPSATLTLKPLIPPLYTARACHMRFLRTPRLR